jgi:hypothetical protein
MTIKSSQLPDSELDELDFNFSPANGSLFYAMKRTPYNPILKKGDPFNPGIMENGLVFPVIAGTIPCQPQNASMQGRALYYDGARIATFSEPIRTLHEIGIGEFERMLRVNNKQKFEKNKGFFRPLGNLSKDSVPKGQM